MTNTTLPTKGRAPAVTTSVTSAAAAKADKQRAHAVAELDYLIGGDRKASTVHQATDTIAVPATSANSSKVTTLAVTQSQVEDAQCTIKLLTSIAAKKKFNAKNKKVCYLEAHAHALVLLLIEKLQASTLILFSTMRMETCLRWSTNIAPLVQMRTERRQQQKLPPINYKNRSTLGKIYTKREAQERGCDLVRCHTAERDACCDGREGVARQFSECCRLSIPIPEKLAKDIEDELKPSSGTIAVPDMGTYHLLTRPIGSDEVSSTQVEFRIPDGSNPHSRYSRSDAKRNKSAQGAWHRIGCSSGRRSAGGHKNHFGDHCCSW
ncbi:unnamed protein product [Peronospora effusa]|nr:unnamed protein product [Peronospora effusa]